MRPRTAQIGLAVAALAAGQLMAQAAPETDPDACLLERLRTAPDGATVGELRAACAAGAATEKATVPVSPVSARRASERAVTAQPFLLTAHRPNYVLPYTYNDNPNQSLYDAIGVDDVLENEEAKFQVSFKFPVWQTPFDLDGDVYFAFSSVSYWQVYAQDISSPFRETNYEPELFYRNYGGPEILGIPIVGWDIGLNHQSNGRADPLSRSWNRVIGQTGFQLTDDLVLGVRAWYRLPEDEEDDDNPNEYRYLGYGDARAIWTPNRNTFTLMVRPGTEKTGVEATWSYPVTDILRAYVQYFNGYGESLLDYNQRIERIGIGIAINDFLQR